LQEQVEERLGFELEAVRTLNWAQTDPKTTQSFSELK
jgi:hypothetical protein